MPTSAHNPTTVEEWGTEDRRTAEVSQPATSPASDSINPCLKGNCALVQTHTFSHCTGKYYTVGREKCSVCLSIAVMKHHDPKQPKEERAYFADTSLSLFIIEGSQGRNSNRIRTWRQKLMQMKEWCLLACSDCLPIEPRTTSQPRAVVIYNAG